MPWERLSAGTMSPPSRSRRPNEPSSGNKTNSENSGKSSVSSSHKAETVNDVLTGRKLIVGTTIEDESGRLAFTQTGIRSAAKRPMVRGGSTRRLPQLNNSESDDDAPAVAPRRGRRNRLVALVPRST